MNKVILLGNIGNDPELRAAGDSTLLRLRVATLSRYRNRQDVWQERTEWHTVVVWGKRGEALATQLGRGDRVFVEGNLRTHSYEKDGIKRYATDVRAIEVQLISRAPRGPKTPPAAASASRAIPLPHHQPTHLVQHAPQRNHQLRNVASQMSMG